MPDCKGPDSPRWHDAADQPRQVPQNVSRTTSSGAGGFW